MGEIHDCGRSEHHEINRLETASDYVCTFEQAKKLYELGVIKRSKSLFYFVLITFLNDNDQLKKYRNVKGDKLLTLECYYYHRTGVIDWVVEKSSTNTELKRKVEQYSAYTSQELGEIIDGILGLVWEQSKGEVKYQFSYDKQINKDNMTYHYIYHDYTEIKEKGYLMPEAQARAAFLIHLLENKK